MPTLPLTSPSALNFQVHDASHGLACSLPSVQSYEEQKSIRVVSSGALTFGNESNIESAYDSAAKFWHLRLSAALASSADNNNINCPSYFPGRTIPGPGGSHCHEIMRGSLLIDQYRYMLSFDQKTVQRLNAKSEASHYALYSVPADTKEEWHWQLVQKPTLNFLYQAHEPESKTAPAILQDNLNAALDVLFKRVKTRYDRYKKVGDLSTLISLLSCLHQAWYRNENGEGAAYCARSLSEARELISQYVGQVNDDNLLAFMFEIEAIAFARHSQGILDLRVFAGGIFADNFVQVSLMSLGKMKATEFCVRERLFDEVINLVGRGFAPVVVNEYGLVADGNHRVTASWIWNILKATQNTSWNLDDAAFQLTVASYIKEQESKRDAISQVSKHEALSHLAAFLANPEYRAKLNTYLRPQLKSRDFISELPVIVLCEYLSGAVVKGLYDEGKRVVRACPSLYEEMSKDGDLVLPPRASYHFTDAALLPWFGVLSRDNQQENVTRRIPASARRSI